MALYRAYNTKWPHNLIHLIIAFDEWFLKKSQKVAQENMQIKSW